MRCGRICRIARMKQIEEVRVSDIEHETQRVFFSGRVQGVGFRWTTQRLAGNYDLTGWVRNLHDGRVEMVAQALPTDIQSLIRDLQTHFGDGITSIERESVRNSPVYDEFAIRR